MRLIVRRAAGLIPLDFGPASDRALLACDTPQKKPSHGLPGGPAAWRHRGLRPDGFLPGGPLATQPSDQPSFIFSARLGRNRPERIGLTRRLSQSGLRVFSMTTKGRCRSDLPPACLLQNCHSGAQFDDAQPIPIAAHKAARGSPFNRSRLTGWSGSVAAGTTPGPWESSRRGSAPMLTAWTTWSGCAGGRGSYARSAASAGAGGWAMAGSCVPRVGAGRR